MGDTELTLTGLEDEHVEAVVGGISIFQMEAFEAGDIPKVAAAGETLSRLAEENPEAVRETFLSNREAFQVAQMPDELLERLDMELRDGQLYETTDEDEWAKVEIDE
jgi:hypothetical protein